MRGAFAIGPFHVFVQWYNGIAFGIRTEEVYELVNFEEKEAGDKIDVDERTAWVLILPLISIYITM